MKKFLLILLIFIIIAAIAITILGATYSPNLTIPPGVKGQQTVVDDIKVRYYQEGTGKDILFIHGIIGNLEDFNPIMDKLATKYRVTAYDRPGHGYSDIKKEFYTVEGNAKLALDLIKTLGLVDPLIVGHSYGGGVALNIASKNLDNIKGFVLISSIGYPCKEIACKEPDLAERINGDVLTIPYFGTGIAMIFTPIIAPSMITKKVTDIFSPNPVVPGFLESRLPIWTAPKSLIAYFEHMYNFDENMNAQYQNYKNINKKVFILQGTNDYYTMAIETANRLKKEIPNSELMTFDKTGHYVQFAHPDVVISVIEKMME